MFISQLHASFLDFGTSSCWEGCEHFQASRHFPEFMIRLHMQLILAFTSLSSQQIWAAREQDIVQPLVHSLVSHQEIDKNGISTCFNSTLLFPFLCVMKYGPEIWFSSTTTNNCHSYDSKAKIIGFDPQSAIYVRKCFPANRV